MHERLGHYDIQAKIGAGGMGEVYRARDTKLDRDVAIKILPPAVAAEPERIRRFEREAKSIAALNHPNIITIHSVEHVDETHFLTMELIDGRSLGEFIPPTGMPAAELLKFAIPLADAMAAAHEAGITHRDLKPDNVMVDKKGRLKVLDFGLAKVTETALPADGTTQAVVTQLGGQVMGTVGYMSPEQVEAKPVDPRSDVFSLGIVLYEMATGERPFKGNSPMSTLSAILRDEPPPVHELRSELPPELSRILRTAMAKDPERRYQTALGLRNDLQALQEAIRTGDTASDITAAQPAPGKHRKLPRVVIPASLVAALVLAVLLFKPFGIQIVPNQSAVASEGALAVLYFENLADPQDEARLGEIVTNLIITGLSESEYLSVVSSQRLYDLLERRGVSGQKTVDRETAGELAAQAGATTMLLGSILKTSPNYVLTAQLVDTATGKILKSQRIDGEPGEEVFRIVDRLSAKVKDDLAVPDADTEDDASVVRVTTHSMDAYRHYLAGVEHLRQLDFSQAHKDLEQAVAIDSTFAMAYYQLSSGGLVQLGNVTAEEQREAAHKAASLVDRVTRQERHYILARAAQLDGNHDQAIAELEQLVEEYPEETPAYNSLANLYGRHRQDPQRMIEWLTRWVEVDPTDKAAYNSLAYAYPVIGDFEKAIWALNQYIQLAPDEANPYDTRGEYHAMMGNMDKARESFEIAIRKDPAFVSSYISLANVLNETRDPDRAREVTLDAIRNAPEAASKAFARIMLAYIPARGGRMHDAIEAVNAGMLADEMDGYDETWHRWKLGVRGRMQHYLGDYELADADLRDAIGAGVAVDDGNAVTPWSTLILSLTKRGELEQAEKELAELKAFIERVAPGQLDIYWICRGWMDLQRGNADAAFENFKQARQVTDSMFLVFHGLGMAHLAAGRVEQAVRELELVTRGTHRSERDAPVQSVLAIYHLGMAYEAANRPDDAAAQYELFLATFQDADPVFDQVTDARTRLERLRPGA